MTYLLKKFVRELFSMKFRAILVILSVGLSVGIYGGLLLVKDNAFASRDQVLEKTNYEDGRLLLYSMIPESVASNLMSQIHGIDRVDFRISMDVTISVGKHEFPSVLHGIHQDARPKVNDFEVKEGKFSSIANDLILEKRFADANNLHVGDSVTVKYGGLSIDRTIGAIVFAPEHMYSMNPATSLPERGVFAPAWFSLEQLSTALNMSSVVNEVLFRVSDHQVLDKVMNDVLESFKSGGIHAVGIKGAEELDYVMMKEDVGTLDKFAVAIGLVILLVAVFIIFDSVMKIINSQRRMIGILRSLGATTGALLVHYMSFGMLLTVLGILLGIPIGYLITLSSTSIFVDAIGFELTANVFRIGSFVPSILIALSVSFLASLVGTIKIAFLTPVEAMDDQTIKQFNRKYFVEGIFDAISTNKYTTKIPVRQVFRRKRRTILTALTIAIAALIILSSFGFLDSFFHQMDNFYAQNDVADMEVALTDSIPMRSLTQQMDQVSGISHYEGMVRQSVYVYGNKMNDSSVVYAYASNTSLRHYHFKNGKLLPGQVAIGQILARKLGVNVGDQVRILTQGKTIYDTIEVNYTISGITEEFFDNFVFIHLEDLQHDLSLGDRVNAVAIQTSADTESVQQQLYASELPIATVINLEQSKASFESLMEAVISFAYFVIFLGIIVLILFSLNVIVLDIMDREREFVNIKVNGASNFIIAKIIGLQILLVSVLVVVIDVFLSPAFTQFIIDKTMRNMAFIQYYMTPISYGLSGLAFVAGISIGLVSAIRNVISANIVDTMRVRFRT